MKALFQVVPNPKNPHDAVTQYAELIRDLLPDYHHVIQSQGELDSVADGEFVLLHYVGFGYSKTGAPNNLVAKLSRKKFRSITFFHELASDESKAPWNKIRKIFQERAILEVLKHSSYSMTSCTRFGEQLSVLDPWVKNSLAVLPLASSIGEPDTIKNPSARKYEAVVLGTPGRRAEVYSKLKDFPGELLDVGAELDIQAFRTLNIKPLGPLSSLEISQLLSECRYGFLEYPEDVLSKSSIFAAYASHGCIPVVLGRGKGDTQDGLLAGSHYLVSYRKSDASEIQLRLHAWYHAHSRKVLAFQLRAVLERLKSSESHKPKTLFLLSHPTQNQKPFKIIHESGKINELVVFLTSGKNTKTKGVEWINQEVFEGERERGFQSTIIENSRSELGSFFGLSARGLLKLVKKASCVVVYGHNYFPLVLAQLYAILLRKPLIVTTDSTSLGTSSLKKIVKKVLFPIYYNFFATKVCVPSSAARDFLIDLGVTQSKIVVTPYCSDEDLFRVVINQDKTRKEMKLDPNEFVFLFVGKLIPRKGIQVLIRAFLELKLPKAKLLIIGEGPLRHEIEIEAQAHKNSIIILGLIPYRNLASLYQMADVLIHPALVEPWGLPVNEAMLSGLPVISSSAVGATRDLIIEGETGWIFQSNNHEDLKSKMMLAFQSRDKLKEMGAAGSKLAQKFGSSCNAEELIAACLATQSRNNA